MADPFSIGWDQFGAAVAAVGALGVAAFGTVESLGKAFAFSTSIGAANRNIHWGLPYAGFGVVTRMLVPLRPALEIAYGTDYLEIIAQQYRAGRSDGHAPDTIRQGVRLGLPFLGVVRAKDVIASVWHMDDSYARNLAEALQATSDPGPPSETGTVDQIQGLAGRFATALDARISAAFQLADERYESTAKTAAGVTAIVLAVVLNWGLALPGGQTAVTIGSIFHGVLPFPLAIGIGLVAVPLAPVAKDISTSLQNALTAFKSISGK